MRLIIAGTRDFSDYQMLEVMTDYYLKNQQNPTIVSGTARGADQLGERYASARGYNIIRFPANWDLHGKAAGAIRNTEMATNSDALLAFWDGQSRGTKHMVETAKKMGLKTRIVVYTQTELYQVFLSKATFGLRAMNNIVFDAAPIGSWMKGHPIPYVTKWIQSKHGQIKKITWPTCSTISSR